ncbi:unnamed protein product [Caenorhabditis sp. 36 PRJEB53466]|nr:unnamed protein product [Caenorhabditis sp. 36 PRJEB53466]
MQLRKKLHDAIVDGEEDDCPKRKIKKLDRTPDASLKVFKNEHIVHAIVDFIIGSETTILDHLNMRLVCKSFNSVVVSQLRTQFRSVQVSPYPSQEFDEENDSSEAEEPEKNDVALEERSFLLNNRIIQFSKAVNYFYFLNSVVRIRIRDLLFVGFGHYDENLHNFILNNLLADNWFFLNSYKGSDEICPGCDKCTTIASRVKKYGPFQMKTLVERAPGKNHYDHLILTEILLAEIASRCVWNVTSREEAFERLATLVNTDITCDQLDLVFSDRAMFEKHTLTHPREVIDCIVRNWKCKSVQIRFLTALSAINTDLWTSKGIFTEMRFDQNFVKELPTRLLHRMDRFERVEVDMFSGDEIAKCFAQTMGMFEKGGQSATAFQNVCANVKRVFPTQDMFLMLPLELARVASCEFDEFCKALLEFAWKDERTARHSRLYFRLYTFGITEKEVMRQVEKEFRINCRPVCAVLSSSSVRRSFLNWLPSTTSTFDRSLLSFTDTLNNCVLHLEVCIEPA